MTSARRIGLVIALTASWMLGTELALIRMTPDTAPPVGVVVTPSPIPYPPSNR